MSSTRRRPIATARLVALLAAFTLLVAACGEDSVVVPEGSTGPGSEATPRATSPAPTVTPAVPAATPTPTAAETAPYGVVLVDVETGDVATLHEGPDPFFAPDDPALGALNLTGALWLSPTTAEAVRYAPDGAEVERIEGWAVLEAPGGDPRTYLTGDASPFTLVVERGGERFEAEARGVLARAFSPDGQRFAWIEPPGGPGGSALHVLDLESGDSRVLAEDAGAPLEWSSSGRYLADGGRVFDVAAGVEAAAPLSLPGETLGGGAWLQASEDEWVASIVASLDGSTAVLRAIGTGDEIEFPLPVADNARAVVLGDRFVLVRAGFEPETVTVVFEVDFEEGVATPVRELRGEADVVVTPRGLASVVIERSELACTGIDVVHPTRNQRLPCEAEYARWSPDGRYLALIPLSTTAPVEVLEVATGEIRTLPHPGPRGLAPAWTADGRYLVWVWAPAP
jgi:hypothetical protein